MTKAFTILNKNEQLFHDNPPQFNAEQRKNAFYITSDISSLLTDIRSDKNKVYFVVAFCYFKETGQFYNTAKQRDIERVAKNLHAKENTYNWEDYNRDTRENHREKIRKWFGFKPFGEAAKKLVRNEAEKKLRSRRKPALYFHHIIATLIENKYEIPQYKTVAALITNIYSGHHKKLVAVVNKNLTLELKAKLDELTEKKTDANGAQTAYSLTIAKRFSHSTKHSKIKKNVELHKNLYEVFELISPIFKELNLNPEGVKSFASSVEYTQVFQVKRKKDDERYLYLIVFVANQFYRLQDILAKSLIQIMKGAFNQATKKAKEEYYNNRKDLQEHTTKLTTNSRSMADQIDDIKNVLMSADLTNDIKVSKALSLILNNAQTSKEVKDNLKQLEIEQELMSGDTILMRILSEMARTLQGKCKGIILSLTFDYEESDRKIIAAIKHYKNKLGIIDDQYPVGFISTKDRKYIETENDFNSDLYKVIFFKEVADALKSEALNLNNAYEYTSLDSNLISRDYFRANRARILKQAEMSEYADFDKLLGTLTLELDRQFKETNKHIIDNKNTFILSNSEGGIRIVPQRNTNFQLGSEIKQSFELYPKNMHITISEALSTVNNTTGFLDEFTHFQHKYLKKRPEDKIFFAAIMGFGFHFGTRKFAKLVNKHINGSTLETTAKSYFSLENIRRANNKLLRFTKKLPIATLFQTEEAVHTSSDGQKYVVSFHSLNANFSFKYGGKDLVIAPYTHIDSRNLFYHSDVISGADREAHYMIDGNLNNEVVKSKLHSTDSHGYSEAVFGLSHLLNISFAPRIKNFQKQHLYSLDNKGKYTRLGYPVVPKQKLKTDLMLHHSEDILRVAASIKLGETTASQVFKRLNSYSKHNPLYTAIKEFGRIPKTLHLLRYMDDQDYRQAIHKQLNKGESGNKLDRAIAIGSAEYSEITKESQEITEGCKRLIKNVIVCWNYMYLSQKLTKTTSDEEKRMLVEKILASSTVTWSHFIIHGEFDLSDSRLRDSMNFKVSKLLDPKIIDYPKHE